MRTSARFVEIDPLQMKAAHAATTAALVTIDPVANWVVPAFDKNGRRILQQKSSDTCARVDGGEDEQRFEHDREVIPVFHQAAESGNAVEDFAMPAPALPRRRCGRELFA